MQSMNGREEGPLHGPKLRHLLWFHLSFHISFLSWEREKRKGVEKEIEHVCKKKGRSLNGETEWERMNERERLFIGYLINVPATC